MRDHRTHAILLTVLLAAVAWTGCTDPPTPEGLPWTPLPCDPSGATTVNGQAPMLPTWNTSATAVAQTYAAAMGHDLRDHRTASRGATTSHEWAIVDADGIYWGQLTLEPIPLLPGGPPAWRLHSEAGLPNGTTAAEAEAILRNLLAAFDPGGAHRYIVHAEEADGLLEFHANQALDGRPLLDTAGALHAVAGVLSFRGVSFLDMAPLHDLSGARPTLDEDLARSHAAAYALCQRGTPVTADRVSLSAAHGSLAYAVHVADPSRGPLQCIPPILVDAVTGAVLGATRDNVCS